MRHFEFYYQEVLLELPAINNDDILAGLSRFTAKLLDGSNNLHTVYNLSEYNMLAICVKNGLC
jgi:hypothetical protein